MIAFIYDEDDINELINSINMSIFDGVRSSKFENNGMDRLEFIALSNPEWAVRISEFLEKFPEFNRFRRIASATERVVKFDEDWEPKTLFEFVIYYVCSAGVRYTYAVEQYKKIVSFLRSDTWVNINANLYNFLISNVNIQQKKKQIYWDIFCWMGSKGIYNNTLTIDQALSMKNDIKGLGEGYYASIKSNYTNDDDCLEYTDIGFIKGFQKLYGKTDKKFMMSKLREYINQDCGRVANSFMFQIFRYG